MKNPSSLHRQSGASLIEVLVSMLILAFGMLALGGMLSYAIQMPKLAGYRATAAMIAASHVERMRANPDGFTLNQYKETLSYKQLPSGTPCEYPDCDATSIALKDKFETQTVLQRELRPLAGMRVTCESDNCALRRGDIWIIWDEPSVFVGLDMATSDECPDPNVTPTFSPFTAPQPRCLHVRFAL
ncbi:MAG: type IV pilus modification protein PilV [Ramlibacter sp.]